MAHESPTVQLSYKAYPAVGSHSCASIDDRGLMISSHGIGPGVSSIWGDSDCEAPDDPSRGDRLLFQRLEQAGDFSSYV